MIAETKAEFKWYSGAKSKLLAIPDKVVYEVARRTLDTTYSTIPLSNKKNSGKLRQSTMAAGVRGSNGNYYIGSYTNYAKRVYNLPSGTNWTTPGTGNKWFEKTFKKSGNSIIQAALERNKL